MRAKAHGSLCDDGRMGARISDRIGAIAESATLAVDAKAKALKAAGRPVIGFGAGEPDFPTPDYIVEAAVEAARDPKLPPLHAGRRAARAARRRRGQDAARLRLRGRGRPGADHQRRQAGRLQRLRNPARPGRRGAARSPRTGRPTPRRSSSPAACRSRSLTDETTGYLATVEQLEAARTARTKVLLFVSPSNPTGAVYPPEQVAAIGALGGGARICGSSPTRSTSTSSTADARARLDGDRGSGARRPGRGRSTASPRRTR